MEETGSLIDITDSEFEAISKLVRENFGINLTLQVVDTPISQSTAAATPDKWDAFLEWHITLPPFTALRNYYHSSNIPPDAQTNLSFYNNPEIDELLEKAERTFDDSERIRLMEQLFTEITDDAPILPIPFRGVYAAWWPWVKNFYGENYYWWAEPPYDLIWIDQELKKKM